MGGSSSTLPSAPKVDYNAATFSSSYVNDLQHQAEDAIKQTQAIDSSRYWGTLKLIGIGIAIIIILFVVYDLLVAFVFPESWGLQHILFNPTTTPYQNVDQLSIITATWDGTPTTGTPSSVDVSPVLIGMITPDFKQLPSFTVNAASLQQPANAAGYTYALNVKYRIGANAVTTLPAVADGATFPTLGVITGVSNTNISIPTVSGVQKNPPVFSKVWSSLFGQGSSNLIGKPHNAESSSTIRGSSAPISDTKDGSYGIQYWMFIRDWNYGYGKDKAVLSRADPTNGAIMNPSISLHPTDNSLKISVSVFPSSPGGSQKTEPAPAGHSGATDDIDSVTIPDIPLQTWFSVSMTVFGRNLDVYIDGKLVTSKLLSGVPKPAVGDIQLTPAGGFSGYLCGFYHYPRMLTPGDTMTFYSSGTPCSGITAQSGLSQATGYSVKFGMYDAVGKEVTEYSF